MNDTYIYILVTWLAKHMHPCLSFSTPGLYLLSSKVLHIVLFSHMSHGWFDETKKMFVPFSSFPKYGWAT